MLNQPRGPYRLTAAEFEAMPVPALQRDRREAIEKLQAALFAANFDGTGFEPITHEHEVAQPLNLTTPGVYTRILRMKAGLRVVGKRHAQEHINIVSCGRATVMTEEGMAEIVGPCEFISSAGTKRFVWVHEDMVWTTIHRTDETDMHKVEASLIIPEPRALP
jgi:ribosomal protein L37E